MSAPLPPGAALAPGRSRRRAAGALWALPVAYAAVIFWLSSRSNPLPFLPPALFTFDKLLHGVEYAGLGALLVVAARRSGARLRTAVAAAAFAAAVYGTSDELHQRFVPGRDADPRDVVADLAGGVVGAGLAALGLRGTGVRASIGRTWH